mmetsp:Transcript_16816/g.24720  ORF Transcript_16816/g.24720 Transcript_16816/m.24720 type:complete len:211 (+) Transcript_16816:444-1076(+)
MLHLVHKTSNSVKSSLMAAKSCLALRLLESEVKPCISAINNTTFGKYSGQKLADMSMVEASGFGRFESSTTSQTSLTISHCPPLLLRSVEDARFGSSSESSTGRAAAFSDHDFCAESVLENQASSCAWRGESPPLPVVDSRFAGLTSAGVVLRECEAELLSILPNDSVEYLRTCACSFLRAMTARICTLSTCGGISACTAISTFPRTSCA